MCVLDALWSVPLSLELWDVGDAGVFLLNPIHHVYGDDFPTVTHDVQLVLEVERESTECRAYLDNEVWLVLPDYFVVKVQV